MSYPPPPPDRLHLQYRPVPPQQQTGAAGAYGPVQRPAGGPVPERPASRPGSATLAVLAAWTLAALMVYFVVDMVIAAREQQDIFVHHGFVEMLFLGDFPQAGVVMITYAVFLVCAVVTAPGLARGKAGARIFGIVWTGTAIPVFATYTVLGYTAFGLYPALPGEPDPRIAIFGWGAARIALSLLIFVLLLTPGVRAWTPRRPAAAFAVVLPQGGQPYGPPQQAPYPVQGGQQYPPQPPYGR